jgi:hypothetical protein
MLVACRLAGLSALEKCYALVRVGAQRWKLGLLLALLFALWLACARLGRVIRPRP